MNSSSDTAYFAEREERAKAIYQAQRRRVFARNGAYWPEWEALDEADRLFYLRTAETGMKTGQPTPQDPTLAEATNELVKAIGMPLLNWQRWALSRYLQRRKRRNNKENK